MIDELLDIIDKENRVIGREEKAVVHERGLSHRVSAVLLRRGDGKYLIPTASRINVEAGGLYHSAAGHVLSGETYRDCARRELKEEAGIESDDPEFLGSFWFEKDYPGRKEVERFEVYKARYTPAMGPVALNEEQVNEQWLSEAELRSIYKDRPEDISRPLRVTCRCSLGFDEVSATGS